ncbi:uncharacterized protein LOC110727633 [Chenopodium quinoa]|uniref:uncharacterized protein LOC110727633 n=1 Tax=Chenopodium quinoa TaxID=63459 RepID=UPI000B778B45|nr:uncharacterized protein LOC110727633 [Chenopodium quinoa]XP_021762913.1 uncharacterized protein LOC110727633 [Chenopodium quinoa]XP_021762920.1 uncharacterized protein LOC110727633 [Chenopodium quinoa]XP_021762925.1 uncharacterized protein LOC110727633 [Chenopodium quinoa]XP_021762932.1 uncharacterized protein LOC110727633 [Chenopodium quinoa]XP_021762937.1 uncharacterized protein LOC110727633 [Chenopodium quinoa]XP_021762939.1 uncharacterized protein LOC110727633 [Chenopodium quinoa]XP_0
MDSLDDPFAEPVVAKAPAIDRFQPKAKPRPKKGPSVAVKATKEPPVTSVLQLNQSNDNVEKKLEDLKSSSLTENESSGLPAEAQEVSGSAVTGHSEIAGPSTKEAETPTANAPGVHSEKELSDFHSVSSASVSLLRPCNALAAPDQHEDQTFENQEVYKESMECGDDGDLQIDVEQLEAGDFSCLDSTDIMTEGAAASGTRAVKFKPKPKAQSDRRKKDSAEAVSHLPHSQNLPSESEHMTSDGSIHAREPNTVSDVVHMRLDGNFSLDPSVYQPDTVVSEDIDSLMPEKLPQQSGEDHREQNSYDALGSSAKSVDEGFLSAFEGNEDGYEPLDGINGGFNNIYSSYDKASDNSALNRDENNDGDHIGEETLQKKQPRKSKKVTVENNKPARKRKKATQELNESVEKPPKKFPRATRRKRCVDKSLLEAPEDELDLQRVPIRDLIILAEYKERQAKKEAAAAMPPPTSERNNNLSPEDLPYDDNETFDQDGDTYDNPSTLRVQKDTGYFNYQSFMTKETRARWTKQDTELFYQSLSQFGSDLSMIQQLFPGRTRHQIKLKYKKEERQNPMRVHDALTSRTQDISHFELVIKRLQEQAAQDEKIDNDDPVCVTGKDEGPEEVSNANEDVANAKQNEEAHVVDQESPKLHYSEDEDYDWSSYKSEL